MLRCWTLVRVMQSPQGIAKTAELIKQGLETSRLSWLRAEWPHTSRALNLTGHSGSDLPPPALLLRLLCPGVLTPLGGPRLRLFLNPDRKILFCQNTRQTPSRGRYPQQGPFWQAAKPLAKAFPDLHGHIKLHLQPLPSLPVFSPAGSQFSLRYQQPQQDAGARSPCVCLGMGWEMTYFKANPSFSDKN